MASALKSIVSKKKRRHLEDGFNLDLSYINKRIIAMGFPAEKTEALYRNSLEDVRNFLERKHKDHYRIYNLCSERVYDKDKFHGRVSVYPFDDHHPPNFPVIPDFCQDVAKWLAEDKDNVAVVHCKAGKGRTGVMICCFLLEHERAIFKSADEVLNFYSEQRTVNSKGVTIPSQRRYISYYAGMIAQNETYKPTQLILRCLTMEPVPHFGALPGGDYSCCIEVEQNGKKGPLVSRDVKVKRDDPRVNVIFDPPLIVCGDIKVDLFLKHNWLDMLMVKPSQTATKRRPEFHFWFNTFFAAQRFNSDLCHTVTPNRPPSERGTRRRMSRDDSSITLSRSHHSNGSLGNKAHSLLVSSEPPSCSGMEEVEAKVKRKSNSGGNANSSLASDLLSATTNLLKHASITDDVMLQQPGDAQREAGPQSYETQENEDYKWSNSNAIGDLGRRMKEHKAALESSSPHSKSFNEKRMRHSSVPQTGLLYTSASHTQHASNSRLWSNNHHHSNEEAYEHEEDNNAISVWPRLAPVDEEGEEVYLQLKRHQVDKVAKEKGNRSYPPDFSITLHMFRPADQSKAMLLLDGPVCQSKSKHYVKHTISKGRNSSGSPDETSSEEEEDDTDTSSDAVSLSHVTIKSESSTQSLLSSHTPPLDQTDGDGVKMKAKACSSTPLFNVHSSRSQQQHPSEWI